MVLTEPNLILSSISESVTSFDSQELHDLVELLFNTMREKNGVGLAAPQIGVLKRVFVYGFNTNIRYPDAPPVAKSVVINPEILRISSDTIDLEEGCLSVPHRRGLVTRYKSLVFSYMDLAGTRHEKVVNDFEARIVQHEIDHINGILISDRANALHQTDIP